jgi:ABC-type Fe3+ transport system permease subunit
VKYAVEPFLITGDLRAAGLLNGTLMSLFAFELPPVDFLYSIQGVILAEMTVFTLW